MKRVIRLILLLAVICASCTSTTPSIGPASTPTAKTAPTASPSPLPAQPPATVTNAPSPTLPDASSTPKGETAAPTLKVSPTPAGQAPIAIQVVPDCAVIPGFPACGKGLPLSGRLAVYDAASQAIRIYDFGAKLAWESKAGAISRIGWLDQGNLLAAYDTGGKAALVWVNPVSSKTPSLPQLSPDGAPIYNTVDGSIAWLDGKFIFHVRLAGSDKEALWPAEAQPSDRIHQLLGWVPGTKWLLAGYHYSGNSMWVTGNRLYTLDATSGKVKELDANLPLNGVFGWHPSQAGLLLYEDSKDPPIMGETRLAVLEVSSGKPAFLVADPLVSSSYPAWFPDGKALIFAARKLGEAPKPGDPFALAAIYLNSYPPGTARRLTQPAAGERDDWPQPLANGVRFLYLRTAADGKSVTLRLGATDGSQDALVAGGLTSPPPSGPNSLNWDGLIAYAP